MSISIDPSPGTTLPDFAASDAQLHDFVAAWERGTLPCARWTHAAHVGVAAFYAYSRGAEETYSAMRAGILNFNACCGVQNTTTSGYHETLTRFWSATISEFVVAGGFSTALDAVQAAVREFGNARDLHRRYYDHDIVTDALARSTWVQPPRAPGTRES
jgi:hypothetical protein